MWVRSLGLEDPLEEGIQRSPVFLPGESRGLLVGYSPQGRKELDVTEGTECAQMHARTHTEWPS